MTHPSPLGLAVSKDGSHGVKVLEFEGRHPISHLGADGLYYKVALEPKKAGRLCVVFGTMAQKFLTDLREDPRRRFDVPLELIGLLAIGEHLDEYGLPEQSDLGKSPPQIRSETALDKLSGGEPTHETSKTSDDEIYAYLAAKTFWSFEHGLESVCFDQIDGMRLGVATTQFMRVALKGEGRHWHRLGTVPDALKPTHSLLRDFRCGLVTGAGNPHIRALAQRLSVPRYDVAASHVSKALTALDDGDRAAAVREGVAAVESLAKLVTGVSGTLGDCIKELKSQGRVEGSLLKALEAVWGYSSSEPDIRHAGTEPSVPQRESASYALDLAAAAVGLFLDLDTATQPPGPV